MRCTILLVRPSYGERVLIVNRIGKTERFVHTHTLIALRWLMGSLGGHSAVEPAVRGRTAQCRVTQSTSYTQGHICLVEPSHFVRYSWRARYNRNKNANNNNNSATLRCELKRSRHLQRHTMYDAP